MAKTVWVKNVSGNDANDGLSEFTAKKTIDAAINYGGSRVAVQGDTIRVYNEGVPYSGVGNYNIGLTTQFCGGTDFDTNPGIIFEGWPADDWPVIDLPIGAAAGTTRHFLKIWGSPCYCDYTWIRNFHFTTANEATNRPIVFSIHKSAGHMRIDCCDVGGMYPWYGGDMIACDLTGAFPSPDDIITDCEISGCYFSSRMLSHVYFARFQEFKNLWIHHCIVAGSGTGFQNSIAFDYDMIHPWFALIEQNTFVGIDGQSTIVLHGYSNIYRDVHVMNNIFDDCDCVFYCSRSFGGITEQYNCFNLYVGQLYCNQFGTPPQCRCEFDDPPTGSISANPAFVGGGVTPWLLGLSLNTCYLPENIGVLVGNEDGGCMGAWLPPTIPMPVHCALPVCVVTPIVFGFGNVSIGDTVDMTFTIQNIGGGFLNDTVVVACEGFSLIGDGTYSLAHDEIATFTVRFTPSRAGEYNCTIDTGSDCEYLIISGFGGHVCDYQKFYDDYPPDWQAELERKIGCTHVTIVCYDPDGERVQLTCMVKELRPLVSEMSVDLKEYQVQDTDIVFVDPTQYLDPWKEGSLLYGTAWKGAAVEVGSWLVGTEKVLIQARLYLDDVKHDGELATWTLHDKFNEMLKRHMRANAVREEDIENKGNAKLLQVTVNSALCPIGDWTLTFYGSDDFEVYSEQLGFEGKGTISGGFGSTSGAIQIGVGAAYWDIPGDDPAAGDTISFTTSLALPRQAAVSALRTALTTYYDLADDELDGDNFDEVLKNTNLWRVTVVQKEPITALEFARRLMKHIAGAIYVASDGRLTIWQYTPSAKPPDVYATCYTDDLKTAKTGTTQTCDVIVVHYGADESGELQYSVRLPSAIAFGDVPAVSYAEYENRVVEEIDLEYFTYNDKSQAEWLCYYLYSLRCLGHRTFELTNKLLRLNAKPGDVVWIDSRRPEAVGCSVFYRVAKDLSARNIEVGAIDSAGWLAECRTGICGWAYACDPAEPTGNWSFCDDECYKVF